MCGREAWRGGAGVICNINDRNKTHNTLPISSIPSCHPPRGIASPLSKQSATKNLPRKVEREQWVGGPTAVAVHRFCGSSTVEMVKYSVKML